MNTTLTPTTEKALKGMKWIAYTCDTTPQFFKTLKDVRIALGYSGDTMHKVQCGYQTVSDDGETLTIDRISRVNTEHIESCFQRSND